MAFMIKTNIDLTGILFLILVTATSQATNQDCNGKAFRCVNSTHFNICVDLGGISTTIDDVIIPCPAPTVCLNTNRFECEFPVLATPSDTSAVTTVSEVTTDTLSKTTTQFDQYFDTIRTTTLPEDVPHVTDALLVEPITQKPNLEHSSITENVNSVLPKQNATVFQGNFNVIPANTIVGNVYGNITIISNNTTSNNNNVTMSFKYDNIGFQKVIPTSVDVENVTSKVFTNLSQEKNNANIIVDAANVNSNIDAVNVSKTTYTSFSTDQPLTTNFDFVNENQTVGISISDYDYSTTVPDELKNIQGTKDAIAITEIRTDITRTANKTQARINQTLENESSTTGTEATISPTSYIDLENVTVDTTGSANNTQTRLNQTLEKEPNTTGMEATISPTSYIDLGNVTVDTTGSANNTQTRLNQTLKEESNTTGTETSTSQTSYIDSENVTVYATEISNNTQTRINQTLEKESNTTRIEAAISPKSYIDLENVTIDTTGSVNSTLAASFNPTLEKVSTITGIEITISTTSYIDFDNVTVATIGSANNTQTRFNQTLEKESNTTGIETTNFPTSYIDLENVTVVTTGNANYTQARLNQTLEKKSNVTGVETNVSPTSYIDFKNVTVDTTGSTNNTETRINQNLEKESNITVIETTTSPTSYVDLENVTVDIRLVIQPTTELPEQLKNNNAFNVSKTNITFFVDSVHSSVLETKINVDVNPTIIAESTTAVEIIGTAQLVTTVNIEPNTTVFAVLDNAKPSINGTFNSELFTPSIADEINVVSEEMNARPVTTVYKEASPLTENSSERNPKAINNSTGVPQESLNVSNSHMKIIEQEIHSINDDIIKQDNTNSIIPTIYEHKEKQISTKSPSSDLIITTKTSFMKLETQTFTTPSTVSISITDTETMRNTTNSTKASKGIENLQLNKTPNPHPLGNKTTSLTPNMITKPIVNVETSSKPDATNYAETSTESPINMETNTGNGVLESSINTIAIDPTQINPIYELQSDAERIDFIDPMIEHGENSTGKLVLKDQALRNDYTDKLTTTVSESDMIINGPTVSTVIDETHITPKLLSMHENTKSVNKTFVQTNIDSESTSELSLSNILSSSNASTTKVINVTAETFTYSQINSTTDTSTILRRNETSGNLVEYVEIITNTENTILSDINNNVTLTETTTISLPAITEQSTIISTEQILAVPITLTSLPPVSTVTTEDFVPTVYIAAEPTNQGDLNTILFNRPIDKTTQTTTQIITTYKNLTNSNKTTAMDIKSRLLDNSTESITEPTGKQSSKLESAVLKNITAVFERPLIGSNQSLNILESADKPINTPIRFLDKEPSYITTSTPIILYLDTETQSKSGTPTITSTDSKLSENIDHSTNNFNSVIITTQTPMSTKYNQEFAKHLIDNFVPLSIPQEKIHNLTSTHSINNSAPKREDPSGSINNVHTVSTPRYSTTDNLEYFSVTKLFPLSISTIKGQQSDVSSSIATTLVTQEHPQTIDAKEEVPINKHIKENITFHIPLENTEKKPLSIQNATETVLNSIKNTTKTLFSEYTTQKIEANIFEPISLDPINNSKVADNSTFANTEVNAIDIIVQISTNLSQNKNTDNSQINITKDGPTEYFVKQNITPSTSTSTLSSPKLVLSTTYSHSVSQSIATTDATTAISDNDKVTTESLLATNILRNNRKNVSQDMIYNVATNFPALKNNSPDNRYGASSLIANSTVALRLFNQSYLHALVPTSLNIPTETENPQISTNINDDVVTINSPPNLIHLIPIDKPITESALVNTNVKSPREFSTPLRTESLLLKVTDSLVITTENTNNQKITNNTNKFTPLEMVTVTTSLIPLEQTKISSSTVTGTVTGNQAVESKSEPYLPAFQSVTEVNTDYATFGTQLADTDNLPNMNKMTVTPVSQSTALPMAVINANKGIAAETHTISAMKFRDPNLIKETVTIKAPDQMIKNTESTIVQPSLLGSTYDFENITPIINSDVLVVKSIASESEITHSGIMSSVTITTERTETKTSENSKKKDEPEIYENSGNKKSDNKENVGNDEENKGELINLQLTSLQDKITPAHTIVTIAKENTNKVLIENSTREELLITTGYTKFDAKNDHIVPISTNYSSTYNINNASNTSVNGHKKETPTRDSLDNSPQRNVSHTSNIKSQDQNISIPQTRNTTVISKDQSTTSGNMSQTKSTAVNTQETVFPALSITRKTNISKFSCGKKRGKFSDSNDCRKFYICQGNDIAVEKACPVNTVFSEINKQCTKNLSHCIRNNQFRCVAEGRFSDFLNDNVYYICVKNNLSHFIRFKLLCQNGYRLNKTSVRCVLNKESPSTSESSKSVSEQSSSPAKIRTPVKTKKFKCNEEGIFPDPSNCRKYFICTEGDNSAYRKKIKTCDSDEVFDKDKKKCVDADSYEC